MTEDSKTPEPGPQKRIFPPLYKSSGDLASDRLAFFHILERLKVYSITFIHDWVGLQRHPLFVLLRVVSQTQKRTGWVDNDVGSYSSDVT